MNTKLATIVAYPNGFHVKHDNATVATCTERAAAKFICDAYNDFLHKSLVERFKSLPLRCQVELLELYDYCNKKGKRGDDLLLSLR